MADESKNPSEPQGEAKVVHLVSSEGDSYEVDVEVCKMSELVKTMLPEGKCSDETKTWVSISLRLLLTCFLPPFAGEDVAEGDTTEIPLPNVKNHVLVKVIEFCKHYKQEPMTEIEKVRLK